MASFAWEGGLALALGAIVYEIFLRVLRRYDRAFTSTDPTEALWWFGYARDFVNFLGFLMFTAAFRILGLVTPFALLAGGVWVIGAYGIDYLVARRFAVARPTIVVSLILGGLALLATVLVTLISDGLAGLVRVLF